MARISVIITAFNLERFVAEAIESVLKQTLKPDEIIVVDDCSTDGTAGVIQSFGNQVRYLRMPENSGGLTATFYGLKQASGELLFFLDGDDVWMPEKLERVVPLFERYPQMAVVSHDYIRVDAGRRPFNIVDDTQENIARILSACPTIEAQSEAFKDSILGKKGYWGGSAYGLRRSFVDTDKFEAWRQACDLIRFTYLDLVLPTFIIVNRPEVMVGYVHHKLFEYRIHGKNTSGNSIPDVNAAKKALRMGHCTTLATYGMLKSRPEFSAYAERQARIIVEYEYLNDIYENKKLSFLNKFALLARRHWKGKQVAKEAKRAVITFFLGPKTFLYLKSKFAK